MRRNHGDVFLPAAASRFFFAINLSGGRGCVTARGKSQTRATPPQLSRSVCPHPLMPIQGQDPEWAACTFRQRPQCV